MASLVFLHILFQLNCRISVRQSDRLNSLSDCLIALRQSVQGKSLCTAETIYNRFCSSAAMLGRQFCTHCVQNLFTITPPPAASPHSRRSALPDHGPRLEGFHSRSAPPRSLKSKSYSGVRRDAYYAAGLRSTRPRSRRLGATLPARPRPRIGQRGTVRPAGRRCRAGSPVSRRGRAGRCWPETRSGQVSSPGGRGRSGDRDGGHR